MQPAVPLTSEPTDSADLSRLRAAARGDVRAYAEIMGLRLPAAFRLACAILGNAPDAADATQDAFTAAWRELPRLRDPRGFDAWFDRILVNACRMQLRRHPAHGRAVGDQALARLRTAATSSTLDEATVLDILDDGFELLDADDRAMLALRLVGGRPVSDIGLVLHLPVGTVKWRLHEARRVLGSVLERA